MTHTPGRLAVASLATHRLIVAVPHTGPGEVLSSLPRSTAADMLRRLADHLDGPDGRCETARLTGRPCPVHDAPAEGDLDRALDDLLAGLDDHLAATAATPKPGPAPTPEGDLDADTVRTALAFNIAEHDRALATLRDVLLDTSLSRTPAQALAAARIILAAHARQIEALIEAHYTATRTRWGLTRSSRGLLTGYDGARKLIAAYAAGLDRDQALAETAEQTTP
ncbi:hypothetical protein SV1_44 [Streptomyces phage SV1]|uniref:hypothetical protein n=1 Tax=Streptomyces phage SV1 TaxID=1204525 RepID=UPI00028B4143|nr:hypothetical protein D280_gp44 [Streptomyces phage SV1]AFU62184.1 hypothetical protein SV1_44 [Streptomyces phage SV1]